MFARRLFDCISVGLSVSVSLVTLRAHWVLALLVAGAEVSTGVESPRTKAPTMADVLAASQPGDWRPLDPENTLYVEFASGQVVIELATEFAPRHVANVKALDARIARLSETVATDPSVPSAAITPASLAGAPASIPRDWFRPAARRFELDIATQDLERSYGAGLVALLDAVDRDDGAGGVTTLMRADYLRQTRADLASLPEVIGAYQACTAFKDAPPRAFRELGYLHRRHGEPALARADFLEYLKRAPTAVDAPIVRSYLESP